MKNAPMKMKTSQLSMTRKCAMSRIYHYARTAAHNRGLSSEKANEAGRKARAKAAKGDWVKIVKALDAKNAAIKEGKKKGSMCGCNRVDEQYKEGAPESDQERPRSTNADQE